MSSSDLVKEQDYNPVSGTGITRLQDYKITRLQDYKV